jgi:hypothetical protein
MNFHFVTRYFRYCLFVLLCLGLSAVSYAHQTGNSYLYLRQTDAKLELDMDFFVRDLGNLLQKPGAKPEPAPPPEKIKALQPELTKIIESSLSIEFDEQPLQLNFVAQSVVLHNDGLYVRQKFVADAVPVNARFVIVRYGFFTQSDKLGRAFLRLTSGSDEISSVFDETTAIQRFALGDTKRSSTILLFANEGAKHIWGGADHLLFLLTLLLPGLLLWGAPSNPEAAPLVAQRPHRAAWVFALKVITAFTVAHSITLAMASFGLISLPERLIESTIALSIIVSAAVNLQQRFRINHWQLAFSFGLIHGMGFANGLKELGLSQSYFLETLIAFNIGVELGQLSTVLLVSVPLVLLARSEQSRQQVMRWGSILVLLIATGWLIQRQMV